MLGGGSLFMWREFLGPQARIIGVDLNPAAKKWEKHGFEIFIGSQSDPEFWHSLVSEVGQIDVVLDDGGHTFPQQIQTFVSLISSIRDDGILLIEDTHTSYMKGFGLRRYSLVEFAKKLVDLNNRRFSSLSSELLDRRTWSVQFFESFVVFHVNRLKSGRISEPTDNGGEQDFAVDFRYSGDRLDRFIAKLIGALGLDKTRIGSWLAAALRYRLSWFSDRGLKLARLFRSGLRDR